MAVRMEIDGKQEEAGSRESEYINGVEEYYNWISEPQIQQHWNQHSQIQQPKIEVFVKAW